MDLEVETKEIGALLGYSSSDGCEYSLDVGEDES